MADSSLPPLPPGFELEEDAPAVSMDATTPPLPEGFVLEDDVPLEIDIVGGTPGAAPTQQEMRALRHPDGRLSEAGWEQERKNLAAQRQQEIDGGSFFDNAVAGFGRVAPTTIASLKQIGTSALSNLAGDSTGLTSGQNAVTQWAGQSLGQQQSEIDAEQRDSAALMSTGGGITGNIAGNVVLGALPGAPVARAAGWGNRALRFGDAALRGGALGALQPAATGDSRAKNIAYGAGFGVAGQAATSAVGRVARAGSEGVDAVKRTALDTLAREQIPVHFSQVSSSVPTKTAASVLKYIPFSGAGKASQNQQEAWNKAISRSFGVESPQLTDDVIEAAKQRFTAGYDDIWSRNQVTVTPQVAQKMHNVVRQTERDFGPNSEAAQVVKTHFNRIMDQASAGPLPGRGYQLLRGELGGVQPGTAVGAQVGKLRKELVDAADSSLGGADAAALKALDKQYNNMKVAESLLRQVAGAGGDIKPSSLWAAVNKRGPKATKQMRELAKAGQTVLKDPIPDSGTAGRFFMGGLLTGGGGPMGWGGALAALPAGAVAGRVLNSPAFGNYVANGGGNALQRLAGGSRALPYLAPAAAAGTQFGQEYLPPEPSR